jgi:hypothetical protein
MASNEPRVFGVRRVGWKKAASEETGVKSREGDSV